MKPGPRNSCVAAPLPHLSLLLISSFPHPLNLVEVMLPSKTSFRMAPLGAPVATPLPPLSPFLPYSITFILFWVTAALALPSSSEVATKILDGAKESTGCNLFLSNHKLKLGNNGQKLPNCIFLTNSRESLLSQKQHMWISKHVVATMKPDLLENVWFVAEGYAPSVAGAASWATNITREAGLAPAAEDVVTEFGAALVL